MGVSKTKQITMKEMVLKINKFFGKETNPKFNKHCIQMQWSSNRSILECLDMPLSAYLVHGNSAIFILKNKVNKFKGVVFEMQNAFIANYGINKMYNIEARDALDLMKKYEKVSQEYFISDELKRKPEIESKNIIGEFQVQVKQSDYNYTYTYLYTIYQYKNGNYYILRKNVYSDSGVSNWHNRLTTSEMVQEIDLLNEMLKTNPFTVTKNNQYRGQDEVYNYELQKNTMTEENINNVKSWLVAKKLSEN